MLRTDRKPWLYISVFSEVYKALGKQAHFILGGSGEKYDNLIKLIGQAELRKIFI